MKAIAAFDQYLKSLGIPIAGISGSGVNCRIDFFPEATSEQKTQAIQAAENFDWEDKPDPDLAGFQESIFQDENIPRSIKLQLYSLFGIMDKVVGRPEILQPAWQDIKDEWADAEVPNTIPQAIEQYATNFNIPLVAPQ
jgi:hypothetical protein